MLVLSDYSIDNFSLLADVQFNNLENEADENSDFVRYTYKWDRTLVDENQTRLSAEDTSRILEQVLFYPLTQFHRK